MSITVVVLYLIWIVRINVTETLSHDDYKEFSQSLCEGQCKTFVCPQSTTMRVLMVKVTYGYIEREKCQDNSRESSNVNWENMEMFCIKDLQREFSELANSKCSHKPNCFICHRRENKARYQRCKASTVTTVIYICVSETALEEVVPSNTYIDLSCANLIEQRIIIHRASLIADDVQNAVIKTKSVSGTKPECLVTDVSSTVSKICSTKEKCQAGPNMLIPNGCNSRKLLLNYSCVPESSLNIHKMPNNDGFQLEDQIPIKEKNRLTGDIILFSKENTNKNTNTNKKDDEDVDLVWVASVLSVLVVIVIASAVFVYWCRSKHKLRHTSLSNKIKHANFSPPPASIDQIEIDLARNNHVTTESSLNNQLLMNNDDVIQQLQLLNNECEYWKNTLPRYPKDAMRTDVPNYSLSGGSSGQMSTYQSESSKGNQSTIFNYITGDKSSTEQTPL